MSRKMNEYIYRELLDTDGNIVGREYGGRLIRCKDCKHRPRNDENGRIRPPRVQVGFYDFGDGLEPEYDDDLTCPYVCDDCWYSRMPSDKQYCDRAEPKEESDVSKG